MDTPDGENCGLVKNLALLAKITIEENDAKILSIFDDLGLIELGLFEIMDMNEQEIFVVVLNGKIVGGIDDYKDFVRKIRDFRRKGKLTQFVSVFESWEDKVIEVWSDAGRMVRPLINVREYKKQKTQYKKIMETFSSSYQKIDPKNRNQL